MNYSLFEIFVRGRNETEFQVKFLRVLLRVDMYFFTFHFLLYSFNTLLYKLASRSFTVFERKDSAELYRAASFYAARDGFVGTDDSSLTERIGFYPKMVDCGYENIKITTPEDLTFARIIIEKRQRQ